MSTASPRVVIFGEAMIELADVTADTARVGVAGDTFNTAVHLARAGVGVDYATALGDDAFSPRVRAMMARENVGDRLVLHAPGRTVGLYAISLDAKGERSFTYWRSASAVRAFFQLDGAEAALEQMAEADLLYLSGVTLSLFTPSERARLRQVAEAVRARGRTVAFDTNYRARGWSSPADAQSAARSFAAAVTLALPTIDDETALFGPGDAAVAVQRWMDAGVEEVALKCGSDGAYVGGVGWVRPPKVLQPVDTTGAGDSFNAGYLAARLDGRSPAAAAMAGHERAAQVLMRKGAIPARDG